MVEKALPGVAFLDQAAVFATFVRMEGQPETEELRAVQREREQSEQRLAQTAHDDSEAAQHRRRAENSRYLREKLDERAASEGEDD